MIYFLDTLAIIAGIIGLLGCILPILPGPPVSFAAMLVLFIWADAPWSGTFMLIWLAITVVVTILDYFVPAYFTRITGGTKAASRFSILGMLLGIIFFPPWGMILGAFIGALAGEMIYGHHQGDAFAASLKPAFGSFLGFLCGTGLKLMASGIMLYYIVRAVF